MGTTSLCFMRWTTGSSLSAEIYLPIWELNPWCVVFTLSQMASSMDSWTACQIWQATWIRKTRPGDCWSKRPAKYNWLSYINTSMTSGCAKMNLCLIFFCRLNSSMPNQLYYAVPVWFLSRRTNCNNPARYQDFLFAFGIRHRHVSFHMEEPNICYQNAVFGYYEK